MGVGIKGKSPLEQWADRRVVNHGTGMDLALWAGIGLTALFLLSTGFGQQLVQTAGETVLGTNPAANGTGNDFEDSLKQTMKWEGNKCSNVAGDAGKLTCKGITDETYRAWRQKKGKPVQSVEKMTDAEMKSIYRGIWDQCKAGSKVMPLSFAIFDSCVNFDANKIQDWFESLPANPIQACQTVFDRRIAYRSEKAAQPGQSKFLQGWLNRDEDGKKFCDAYAVPGRVDTNRGVMGDPADSFNQGHLPLKLMSHTSGANRRGGRVSDPTQAAVILYANGANGGEIGSGAIISPDGLVLTAAHVVKCHAQGGCQIHVTLSGGARATATVVKYSHADDLALLKLTDGHYLSLPLAEKEAGIHDKLTGYGYGNPVHSSNQGQVQSIANGRLVFSAESFQGNSGGFLLNSRQELAGIIQARMEGRGDTVPTQAASINTITRFLRQ